MPVSDLGWAPVEWRDAYSADSSTALGKETEMRDDSFYACNAIGDLLYVSTEFLSQG